MESNRFLIVPLDSSAARMPLPGATSACAISSSDDVWMAISLLLGSLFSSHYPFGRPSLAGQRASRRAAARREERGEEGRAGRRRWRLKRAREAVTRLWRLGNLSPPRGRS